ncbi:SDR family NAD(P)-dependent oxidoreductase [Spiractinospora alimapuensis]|uniref:type I polyketide synthase n=1 Tax=Spiractinospora alimapuensis TaxID=2820884 RepID=UPI001F287154|nr:type I polyketide synthase [Spiractinospora alimapuensis]QVQ52475.1 SDR family NAD(P)-dependent oxidoreductase [Spiractinospora alimapuensis]
MSNEDKFRELLKRTTVDLRAERERVAELEERDHEPIAIVGIGCRYPGGATSPERLWEILAEGGETLSEFPTDRGWDLDRLFDPDPEAAGTSYVRRGSFLHDAGEFDAGFFGISPREALAMDPQQRLALEVSWEAVEHAGIDPKSLAGTPTGVFLGIVGQSYGPPIQDARDGLDGYLVTGTMPAVAAGRIAYSLGLRGPAVPVDTSCSSSLVALHHAARSLRAQESRLALVGGVMIYTGTGAWVSFSRQRGLAPDARCKAFGAGADGTGWAEGVGMLVLERLSDAQRNGRRILGVVRGSAINQDGASSGLTAPNGTAQREVIRHALNDARLGPADVDVVEAHGTGTALGDPIEASALIDTYGRGHSPDNPLWLGSIKTNIGHTGPAAGIAGIKIIESMRHGELPRTLHADTPSPNVDWSAGTVALTRSPTPWKTGDRPRRAGVSSFGVSGTNAHVIVEEPPTPTEPNDVTAAPAARPVPWLLSARTASALEETIHRLATHAAQRPGLRPADIGWTLATGRADLAHRAAVVASTHEDFLTGLRALTNRTPHPNAVRGQEADRGGTVFVFPGQGAQWAGMADQLMADSPVFAQRMRECADALAPHLDYDFLRVVRDSDDATLARPDVLQPALFAVMVSLAALWEHHGIRPDAVVGHSQGEIAAACVAGILTLEDAARIVAVRSALVAPLAEGNAMLALALPPGRQVPDLSLWHGELDVAAVNSPTSVVVAGENSALEDLSRTCADEGVFAFGVPGSFAAHSPRVESIHAPLVDALAGISPTVGSVPLYSTVTGSRIDGTEMTPEYWYRNIRRQVRFAEAVTALRGDGHRAFVECSANPVLTVNVEQNLDLESDGGAHVVLGTLRAGQGGLDRFLTSLAEAHVHGLTPDWEPVFVDQRPQVVDVPTYPFERRHFWLTAGTGSMVDAAGLRTQAHGFLSAAAPLAESGGVVMTGRISRTSHPWLVDHAVNGTPIVPGTGFLELALHAADALGCSGVEELVVHAPLAVPDEGGVQLQLMVSAPRPGGEREYTIHSRPWREVPLTVDTPWTRHASGTLTTNGPEPDPVGEWPPPSATPVAVDDLYPRLAGTGYGYGPAFQGLRSVWRHNDAVLAEVELPEHLRTDAARYGIHPALMDAAQHAMAFASAYDASAPLALPFAWSGVHLHAANATRVRVRIVPAGADSLTMELWDPDGEPVATVESLTVRPMGDEPAPTGDVTADDLFHVEWVPVPAAGATSAAGGPWAVLGGDPLAMTTTLAAMGIHASAYADVEEMRTAVAAGAPAPTTVLAPWLPSGSGTLAADARNVARSGLHLLHQWLDGPESAAARLVILTWDAVAAHPEDSLGDLASSGLWGLVRTAQMEAPDQVVLVDIDDPRTAVPTLPALLDTDEPQLAVRNGALLAPRVVRTPHAAATDETEAGEVPRTLGEEGTVLVTGATGTLGGLVARHLVTRHGARHLLLVSRSGEKAPGAIELRSDLEELGAHVRVASCDVADAAALRTVIGSIDPQHPLRAVVHVAGTLDDGTISALTPGNVDTVMRPKADAALHLHELTADTDLDAFVMFSSAASTFGSPGQANYGAASAVLDALAHHRRARGLPATSISWGMWEQRSSLTAKLDDTDLNRYARMGVAGPLSDSHGVALFDAALASDQPHLVAVPLDLPGISASSARSGTVAPLLRGLVRPVRRRRTVGEDADAPGLARRLAATDTDQRRSVLLDLVTRRTAEVLGHDDAGSVQPGDSFLELGYDSLTAVELRNHLAAATDLRLPAGLIFAHTTPDAVADHLHQLLGGARAVDVAASDSARGANTALHTSHSDGHGAASVGDGLPALFRACYQGGKIAEGFRLVEAAAQIRETFGEGAEFVSSGAVWLAHGVRDVPMMICLPSILMISGVQEYARFAAGVRGLRDVAVIPQPGFVEGEPLPDSVGAVVDTLAAAVRECAGERPYVLVARSSGGWVAHAVAERLEGEGFPARALGLLDPPSPDDGFALPLIEKGLVEREQQLGIVDATRLTAMGGYMRLFSEWMPDPIETPTVVLRAEEATPDRDGHPLPPFTWKPPHTAITVSGDHFSMLEEHVDDVARVLHDWLAERGL